LFKLIGSLGLPHPMEFLPEENVQLLTALGRFTARFAAAETGLDVCNALIFYFCEGRTVEPQLPRFLERKLAFFNTCQERCTKLATADPGFRDWAAEIFREFTAIKNDRHFLIHGIADELLTNEDISLSKFRFSKAEIVREETTMMSLDSIVDLGDRAWQLSRRTLAYSLFLLRFAPEDALVDMLSDPETKQLFAGFPSS
jgi:hypothetical protein